MSAEPRRSSRANKGTHTGRDVMDVYYQYEEEPDQKKRRTDGDFQPDAPQTKDETPDLDLDDTNLTPDRDLEGDVRCDPCGTTQANYNEETDQGGMMIECERCATWQHSACMGYKSKRAIPEHYMCNRCRVHDNGANTVPTKSEAIPTRKPTPKVAKVTKVDKTRASVTKALTNVLAKAHSSVVDAANAEQWASQMEKAIHAWSGTTDKKYIDKSRSVMALVKKAGVFLQVVSGTLSVEDLVVLPPEEIDSDLKNYAEKVRQELIRRSVLTVEDELSQRIRRTHKGEEVVESTANEEDFNVNMSGRNIDHRVFREVTPTRETVIANVLTGPNLYQISDDDDDEKEKDEKNDEDQKDENEETSGQSSRHDDSDDELDFILGAKDPKKSTEDKSAKSPPQAPAKLMPKIPPTMSNRFWSGDIVFPDFVQFAARAVFVGCTNYQTPKDVTTASFHNRAIRVCKELLEKPRYAIEGRLDRTRADPYVEKITSSRDLYVVKIESSGESKDFDKLFDYLYSRTKVGVLSGKAACVKDSYLYAFDNDVPAFLNLGPVSRGLYCVFVVRKDYVPVGKSILKKALLPPQQQAAPASNLDSILSKLAGSLAVNQEYHQPMPAAPPQDHQQAPPVLPLELTPDQLQYLSELVSQNPHVQQNPQALISLLQNNQMPGYH